MRDDGDCTGAPYSSVIDFDYLRSVAEAAGAAGFGVTTAEPFAEPRRRLIAHGRSGMSGPLRFTFDDPETATDVAKSFPWAKSIVVFSSEYLPDADSPAPTGPVIGRFATRDFYEPVRSVARAIEEALEAAGHRAEILIDDNRLVDRSAAARAGVGWIGKSTMILAPGHGPWLLLGSVVTDAVLSPTRAMRRDCGTCVACIPACPTGAITDQGLDARRCISTWLQTPGSIPFWIRPHIGRRVYGCDDCLTSCPPGHRALESSANDHGEMSFRDLLDLSDEELVNRFPWWYVPRRDGRFLRRNLLVAAGNSREEAALRPIRDHLPHPSSMIRGHAYWALARSLGREADPELRSRLDSETVPEAIDELGLAIEMATNE